MPRLSDGTAMPRFRAGRHWLCAALVAVAASCDTGRFGPLPVGSVRIVNPPASLAIGETVTLSAVVLDASDKPLADAKVYWGAEDTTIVKVDSVTGVARARTPGTTRIAATSWDRHVTIDVVVPDGPAVPFNTGISDTLSAADDVDEFTFQGSEGQEFNVLLKGNSGVAAHQFRLRLLGPGGTALDSVASRGDDPELRRQAIKWLRLPASGTYRLRIDGGGFGAEKGAYQLRVERIDTAPESVPDTIPPGVRITDESLSPGDIDDFTFTGAVGQDYSFLFQAQSGVQADALILRLLAPNLFEPIFVHSNGDYTTSQGSGRITLAQDGRYTVRIQGRFDAEDQGPYEFQMFRINRNPERISRFINLDNNVGGESLEPQGDLDEFRLTVPADEEVNVYLQSLTKNAADTMYLRVLDARDTVLDRVMSIGTDSATLYGRAISHLRLSAATYRVQVEGSRNTQGMYRFLVRSINLAPEVAAATLSYGAVVTTEEISPVGDVDQFTFRGVRDHNILVGLRAQSGSSSDVLRLYLYREDGTRITVLERNGAQNSEDSYTWVLPATENYRIRVQGVNGSDDGGRYQIRVVRIN